MQVNVYEGDCLEILSSEEISISPQLVYADPPFGRGSVRKGKRGEYSDELSGEAYNEWLLWRLDAAFDHVREGWLCLHHCPELAPSVIEGVNERYGECYGQVVWQDAWVSGFRAKAKFWPRIHDLLHFWRIGDAHFEVTGGPPPADYKRRGGGEGKFRADPSVWVGPWSPGHLSFSKEKVGYPDQKPIALLERIISATTKPGDLVLDPFCGSGTTLVAAHRLGRNAIGIDQNVQAVEIARRRMEQ